MISCVSAGRVVLTASCIALMASAYRRHEGTLRMAGA